MRVFMTGGTGLIGRHLGNRLVERGDEVIILTRRADAVRRDPAMRRFQFVPGDPGVVGDWQASVDGCDAVVNLVGHNVFANRWNAEVKRKIRDSRVYGTNHVVSAITRARNPPRILAQASAVGYYGPHGDEVLTEESPSGADFMSVICREWEEATRPAENQGTRVARVRIGIVLARHEGALAAMTPLFRLGPGVPIGGGDSLFKPSSGQQWMSWIHIDDIVGLFLLALDNPEAKGPLNGTSPEPVRNADFARTLSKVLWKPYAPWRVFLPFGPPDILLRAVLGDVANVVTKGQRVLPTKAESLGYQYRFPNLEGALRDIYTSKDSARSAKSSQTSAAHPH